MKEQEFRGKRKDNGNWVYGDLIQLNDGRKFIVNNKFGACFDNKGNFLNTEAPFVCEVIPETIGEYIGREDNLHRKIYTGDIVIGKALDLIVKGAVEFEEITCSFFIENILSLNCNFFGNLELWITGNIHDTPEQLKLEEEEKANNE